jgi:pyrroline-5-carboxylate reductase
VLFAVKPQNTTSLFKKLHGRVPKDAVILSIIAGVPVEDYVEGLGHRKVVRSMPNTPATVRQGMTVWCCTSELCAEERDSVGRLLGTMGLQQYVSDETYLDMATAVSGSGPAYVLLVIEALIDSSVHMGFPRDMATKLVLQTVSPRHRLFGPAPLT